MAKRRKFDRPADRSSLHQSHRRHTPESLTVGAAAHSRFGPSTTNVPQQPTPTAMDRLQRRQTTLSASRSQDFSLDVLALSGTASPHDGSTHKQPKDQKDVVSYNHGENIHEKGIQKRISVAKPLMPSAMQLEQRSSPTEL
jgi:hypothetical protein